MYICETRSQSNAIDDYSEIIHFLHSAIPLEVLKWNDTVTNEPLLSSFTDAQTFEVGS
jgi:hypothetical protein